jgi:hypothetical protein
MERSEEPALRAMTTTPTLEQRVAALEAAIREMKSHEKPQQPWLARVSGILAGEPEFAKVMEYGRYWREHGQEPPQVVE